MQPLVLSNFLPILLICTWPHPSAGKIQLRSPRGAADDTTSLLYLQKFGYLAPTSGNSLPLIDGSALRSAVKEFQEFAGLTATGDLDQETLDTMALPRCGVKDKVGKGVNARRKRYALQGSRWRVRDLNYTISQYPSSTLSKSDVDKEVQRAFQIWSDVTDLNFRHVEGGKVHIDIRFAEGEHGDGDPFDGPGGTLAHAFFPIYGGDAHFDDKEQWTIDSYRGTNFFQVAAHEFGHSLGLSHSEVRSALMAPFYRGFEPNFKLNSDDISAIQGLYGDGKGKGQKDQVDKPVTAPSVEDPDLCNNPEVDLVVTIGKETFAFKGDKYWQLTETAVAPGYPKKISDDWPGLPNDIDTAFTWTNGKTYFFKGSEYWRYTGREADKDYPKKISEGFEGIPDNIDAAFVWSGNGQIYFFKGNKYWKYNPAGRPPVSDRYPKPLSYWSGIPADGVDSVVQYVNGYTYFFKDGKYWRFNDGKFEVDAADPPYPRDVAAWWFGCDKGQLKMQGDRADILPDTADHQGSLMDAEGRSPSSKNMGARNCMTPLFILSATLLKSGLSDLLNMGF